MAEHGLFTVATDVRSTSATLKVPGNADRMKIRMV